VVSGSASNRNMIKLHPQNEQVVFKPFMGILDEHFPVK
jgi:hypothetical protein